MFGALTIPSLTHYARSVVDKISNQKMIYIGNFIGWCTKNRTFTFGVTKLQLDIQARLMGSSFWMRHRKTRSEKFGVSNLNDVLKLVHRPYATLQPMSKEELKERLQKEFKVKMRADKSDSGSGRSNSKTERVGGARKDKKIDEEEEEEEEEELLDPNANKDADQLETEQLEATRNNLLTRKSRMTLGKTILAIDAKRARGERLNGEESWLWAKAIAQSKTANKLYMRQSIGGNVGVTKRFFPKEHRKDCVEEEVEVVPEEVELKKKDGGMTAAEQEKLEKVMDAARRAALTLE